VDFINLTLTTGVDTLILQLGVILNTVPAWKKAYKLRVAVFVEYESDVKEERCRVKVLLENLRMEAEILVFCLASGDLKTYEIIINGASRGKEAEEEVEECLAQQTWWDEIQKLRGNRGPVPGENLSDLASIFSARNSWPDASFKQGPRAEKVKRFLGLRRLLKKSKRRQSAGGIAKLGVNLGMRAHSVSQHVATRHASIASASEDSASDSDSEESDSEAVGSSDEADSLGGAASEADMDDYELDTNQEDGLQQRPILRRRSHGDSMRGSTSSKRLAGERRITVLDPPVRETQLAKSGMSASSSSSKVLHETSPSRIESAAERHHSPPEHEQPHMAKSGQRPHLRPDTLSRHSSMPKFSSKTVPETRVATEDGPERSIMFTDTPSPGTKRSRLPSAYYTSSSIPDNISETPELHSPTLSRTGSTYSTQSIPLSFNDLPSRGQHLIINELMRSQSNQTAVIFTTLPTPMEGTCESEEVSVGYLGDLEVLCKGCPPVLMVHSNSMTVTMSL
jgi:potassium/chloride transporter 9